MPWLFDETFESETMPKVAYEKTVWSIWAFCKSILDWSVTLLYDKTFWAPRFSINTPIVIGPAEPASCSDSDKLPRLSRFPASRLNGEMATASIAAMVL